MENMCSIIVRCLVLMITELFPLMCGEATQASIFLIMPDRARLNKNLKSAFSEAFYTMGLREFKRSQQYSDYILKQNNIIIDKQNPQEILDLFCHTIFKSHVNTILYFQLHPTKDPTPNYIINMAEYFKIPVISWDSEFPGALQNKQDSTVLQMAPTIYHQSILMIDILKKFNWTNFAVVTTTTFHYLEFTGSIDHLVKEHNKKVKFDRKLRFNLLSSVVVHLLPSDNDTTIKHKSKEALLRDNKLKNRVFLIHASSREAKNVLEVAGELGLTGKDYIWIMSSFCIGVLRNPNAPRVYPLGSLGITYSGISKDGFEDQLIENALKTSVRVWVEALKKIYNYKDQYKISPNFSCQSQRPLQQWRAGEKFYRLMRDVRVERPTAVQFSENGVNQLVRLRIVNIQRQTKKYVTRKVWKEVGGWVPVKSNITHKSEMRVEMTGITWPGNTVLPPLGKPEKRFMRIATLKEKPYVFYVDRDANGKCVPPAVPCRVMKEKIVFANDSFRQNQTVPRCCAGLCIDILSILSSKMQFDYELYEVPDRTWGLPDQKTGEWNGLIKQIQDNMADMVLTSLKITPKRSEAVDFSIPFLETGITIIVSIRKGNISPTAFLEPYDYPSWCFILVFSVHATGAAIFIYEWLSPRGLNRGTTPLREHRFSLFRSFWLIWAMLFGASVSTDNPRGVSSRFLSNVWALFALVFLASYTANLAAFMITKDEYYNLSGIKDWRLSNPYSMKPPFKFATIPNGSTEENLRKNHYNMFKYMQRYNRPTVDNALRALKQGKIQAFIYDATPLEFHAGNDDNCELKTVGEKYAMTGYGIAVPQKTTYLEEINDVILELQENGELERLRRFWLAGACHMKRKRGQSSHTIGIPNFTSAFILLASGVLIGGLVLLVEHLYFKFGRRCLRKYDKNMCCALVSLSMGQSLTFQQSVMNALARQKHHDCRNPRCELLLWKERHNHDLSQLYISTLKDQLKSYGITPVDDPMNQSELGDRSVKQNGYPNTSEFHHSNPHKYIENRHESDQLDYFDSTPVRWKRKCLKRSPSYTNAVDVAVSETPEKHKVRFNEGKFYFGVDNDSSDQDLL
ncbi:glutamate receptor ionotropic, NMDA 2B-like [Ostrea edulis]|uniref:glutamate receptor ionotropic, NMDA 2B-like n=1 Tax=Ostrea edulis TaxID=37623 RepID=UPI0024AF3A70|nr:glutamate receptor ionotropic, NMDA 2B-like [Ostrea edulis]